MKKVAEEEEKWGEESITMMMALTVLSLLRSNEAKLN